MLSKSPISSLACAALLALSGCTSSDSQPQPDSGSSALHPYSGGSQCVDYPDSGYRVFPYLADAALEWPACPLNCTVVQAQAGSAIGPLDQALPSGACTDEGAACQSGLMAGWCPPCFNGGGPGNAYVCVCRGLQWHCALAAQGKAMCAAPACLGAGSTPVDGGNCHPTWTSTEVCACGKCWSLCAADSDCDGGQCKLNTLCFPTQEGCAGPDECPTTCSGFCE
ncbi:MAG: hypothetical protein HY898_17815 [Deltaproteobacteria bacterium]|nr:hypothetical protein [Deltaproteobacteria bacterium]